MLDFRTVSVGCRIQDIFQVKEKIVMKSTLEAHIVLEFNFQIWQRSSADECSAFHMLREIPRGFLLSCYTTALCMGLVAHSLAK